MKHSSSVFTLRLFKLSFLGLSLIGIILAVISCASTKAVLIPTLQSKLNEQIPLNHNMTLVVRAQKAYSVYTGINNGLKVDLVFTNRGGKAVSWVFVMGFLPQHSSIYLVSDEREALAPTAARLLESDPWSSRKGRGGVATLSTHQTEPGKQETLSFVFDTKEMLPALVVLREALEKKGDVLAGYVSLIPDGGIGVGLR